MTTTMSATVQVPVHTSTQVILVDLMCVCGTVCVWYSVPAVQCVCSTVCVWYSVCGAVCVQVRVCKIIRDSSTKAIN